MHKLILPLILVIGMIAGFFIARLGPGEGGTPADGSIRADAGDEAGSSDGSASTAGAEGSEGKEVPTEAAADGETGASLSLEQKIARIEELKLTPSLENSIRTLELIAGMSESELEGMLQQMGRRGMGSISDWMMPYHVFTAWVEKNPQNAYKFFEEEANPMQQQMYGSSLFSAWAATDPEGALAAVEGIEDKSKREQAYGAIAMSIAGRDPNRAFDLLESREESNAWQYQTVFMLWAGQNQDAALAKIESMEIGEERTHAMSGLIQGMASKDIDRAAAMAMSLDRDQERERALQTILHTWVNQDMEGALEFVGRLEEGEPKNRLIQGSVWALARADPERALEFVHSNMTGRAQDHAVSNVIRQMAREGPEEAARVVAGLPYGRVYSNSIEAIAREWGGEDPMAALAWAESLGEGEEKERAFGSILSTFAENKTDEAKAYLQRMPEGKNRADLAGHIAQKMARTDPQATLRWTESLEDASLADRASDAAISAWAVEKPQEVVEYLQSTGGKGELQKHARMIADNWAKTDVKGAADWALTLEGKAQEEAIGRVSWEWLEHNTEEASVWIADLESGPARDHAVRNLVNKVYRSDPEAAFAWATTLEKDNDRAYNAQRAIREMKAGGKTDEARQAVRTSDLSDGEKEKLLKELD
ncbi:MAG: hypothetical protein ACLFVC_00930 [Opitutales bacterium]